MASQSSEDSQVSRSGLVIREDCLGIIRKNGTFTPMTNFIPGCVGYVRSPTGSNAIGFLVKIRHSDSFGQGREAQIEADAVETM